LSTAEAGALSPLDAEQATAPNVPRRVAVTTISRLDVMS
jgi:hypothetical protein